MPKLGGDFMAGKANLDAAKAAKNDEFYTQWDDIENEMQAYLEYDPDVFRGKVVLLPCDDPEASNFTRYFALNFNKLGLKKLISTSYSPCRKGRIYVTEQGANLNDGANLDKGCLKWDYLEGDGDFRSDEVMKLRDEADIVVTNPPFSLFREFLAWLVEGDVEFAVIGNMNAVTYKEIFPLIKDNEMWPGAAFNKAMEFAVPADYYAAKDAELDKYGNRLVKVPAIAWFTNIEHGRRHELLELMTLEDNLVYGSKKVRSAGYPNYDNYDAVEVPSTSGIPSDYEGVMGVPISFLGKYNPEQFEIVKFRHGDDGKDLGYTQEDGTYKTPYFRILIRHRNPERKDPQPLSRSRGGQSSLRCKRGFSHIEVRG